MTNYLRTESSTPGSPGGSRLRNESRQSLGNTHLRLAHRYAQWRHPGSTGSMWEHRQDMRSPAYPRR